MTIKESENSILSRQILGLYQQNRNKFLIDIFSLL